MLDRQTRCPCGAAFVVSLLSGTVETLAGPSPWLMVHLQLSHRTAPMSQDKASSKPARPIDSGTLIVVRKGRNGPEVLMGRRGRKAVFGGVYVFPGGKVDGGDRRVRPSSDLAPDILARLSSNTARARGFAAAAVRETFEETGLLLANTGAPGITSHDTWRQFGDMGVAPDLGRLLYIGHAITPSTRPVRFNARFFMAWADEMTGELGGSGELDDLSYLPIDEALSRPLVDVTTFMLGEIKRRSETGFAPVESYPYFSWRRGGPYFRYS